MMKTNAKRKNSAAKKLIPAAGMLALSASMLATSTYAWFTMSTTVKVDGMQLKTKVSGNLLISDSNVSDAYYGTNLIQTKKALLEPVSSVKGVNDTFWYTLDASADGSKRTSAATVNYLDYETNLAANATSTELYDNKFSEDYLVQKTDTTAVSLGETGAKGYVDYVFWLKATPDSAQNYIKMTKCNLTYNDGAAIGNDQLAVDKAWRIAVFAQTATAATAAGADGDVTPAGNAANLIGGYPLGFTGATYFDNKAVSSATEKSAASIANTGIVLNSTALTAGTPAYYKVVVRLWLEGEDTTCKTENYTTLNNDWQLDLEFKLVGQNEGTAVTNIGTVAKVAFTDDVPNAS
jgi:hypothetical protein